jgi:hypothetical protein
LARRHGLSERTVFRWTFERSRGGRPRQLGRAIRIDEYARHLDHLLYIFLNSAYVLQHISVPMIVTPRYSVKYSTGAIRVNKLFHQAIFVFFLAILNE